MGYNDYMRQREAMIKAIQAQAAQDTSEQPTEQDRAHLFTTGAGVGLPMLQAVATGVFFGGLACWVVWQFFKGENPWRWGLGAFLLIQAAVWMALLWRWLGLTKPLERLTGIDFNGDGRIGDLPARPVVKVELRSEDGRQTQFAELPTTQEKMSDFARGVLAGTPISERTWSGAGALFSQNEFRAVRDVLLARGWIRWVNAEYPQQGLELAPTGRAVMRQFASETVNHSPTLPRAES